MLASLIYNEIILIYIIKFVLLINNIITKISFILKSNEELMMMKYEKENYKLMLKYYNEDNKKIIILENKLHKYYNLNFELIKKIDEVRRTLTVKKETYKNLESELNINIDDYFNLKLRLEQSYHNNKHLKFLLKKSNCNNRTLVKINRRLL
jgi:hypothetical protein